jgi:hypothetical protein
MSTPSWGSPTPPPQYAPPAPAPRSKWKIAGIGCGGLFGAFVVLVIIVAIVDPTKKTTPAAQPVAVVSATTSQSAKPRPSSVTTPAKAKAAPKAKPRAVPTPKPKATKAQPSPQPSCSETRDLIVWYVVPTLPDSAQELGNYNLATCETTLQELQDASPTGPGYCTEAAWVSDNPGYDADATPAKEPKDVVLSVGPACD